MFLKHQDFTPVQIDEILGAAEAAMRAIPPAFPLAATVAVNPFLGQGSEDLATAAARLGRVAGVSLTRSRAAFAAQIDAGTITDADLKAALSAAASPVKPADLLQLKAGIVPQAPPTPLPTVADLAATATGTDWPSVIVKTVGLWAAGHFDQGQALWSPRPATGAYAAWRAWASHDLTPEIAGLSGFCAQVSDAPDTAERAILRSADRLGLTGAALETAFHRLLMDLGGWAQHARWCLWQAELAGDTDATLGDLLAIRLLWDEALLAHAPGVAEDWAATVAAHVEPVTATPDQVLDAILQDAAERAYLRGLSAQLTGAIAPRGRPALQAVFCIDTRSEVFRRALESQSAEVETLGFAGFFGLPVAHRGFASDSVERRLPALLTPALTATSSGTAQGANSARIGARAVRAWGRFRQAAVSSFAFVEAAGPVYGAKLVQDALGWGGRATAPTPLPVFEPALSPAEKTELAAKVLTAMGLTQGLARVVALLGHGAQTANNPHESAYHCGACGGHSGEVSARLLAGLLNDPETRSGLQAQGLPLPADTVFVAGLHNTTTDAVTLFDSDAPTADLAQIRGWLSGAAASARAERALRLPGASASTVAARATNWAQLRPEWGLANCAAFIAAPRAMSAGRDLGGRAFLHSYDWRSDTGFQTLELILTAPVVVASWISLQYYGASVAPEAFGSGNKLIHNTVSGIGVVEGNGGTLRAGLPRQALHDGQAPSHDPLRLSVLIEAPQKAITAVLSRHPDLRALFDNGWLALFALQDGQINARYHPGLTWEACT